MAAPELRLNVTLDLAAFRTQLTKLTSTAKSEIEDQDKIAIPVGIKSSVTKKDATAVTSEIYKTIKESALQGAGGKIRIPVSIKPSITKKDVTDFKKAVQDSLSGISVNVKANVQGGGFAGSSQGAAGLMQYMQQQGMIGKTASGMTMSMQNKSAGGGGGLPPSGGGGGATPVGGGGGGGGGVPPRSGGGGAFAGMQLAMPQLPGRGIMQELGTEFSFAAKQVLLFGAAYKALAFLTDFPSKVGEAVGQLQSFRNTLKSITPSTAEFGQSSQFILSLVDQYNIPLQSARDGFAKLYASMQPAGFSGKEIRDLFEGVSMGAATFGMSADKVDRVMYAFAQMASKGQIMSEELKGQLGDVLPGSLALFAKAAKMSVSDFSKAMEDGAFKGNAMRELLIKVGATMKEEFGKGAIGAAATFQGVMNRLQTSTTLFYEAFEPAAVAFSNTFVLPLTNGLRVVTDAFTQLMTGQKAVTASGSDLAAKMQPFIPIFQGIGKNLVQVGQAALGVAKSLTPIIQLILQLLASPIVGWLAQVYASVILLQGAFTLLGGRAILGAIAGLAQYSIGAARAAIVSQTMASQALSAQMQLRLLASGALTTGVAMSTFAVAVRTAFITTAAGAVVVAVGMMIAEFMRLRGVMDDIEGRYKSVADQARMMGESGNVGGIQKLQNNAIQQANTYEKILKGFEKAQDRSIGGQEKFFAIPKDTADLLKKVGQGSTLVGNNIIKGADIENIKKAIDLNRKNYKENQKIIDEQENKAKRKEKELKAGGPGTGTKNEDEDKKKTNLETYYNLKDQLAKASTQAEIDRAQMIFDHQTKLMNLGFDLREARANSFQKDAIRFQRELAQIEQERANAMFKARSDVLLAQGSVAGGTRPVGGAAGGAAGGATGAGIIEYISGDPSRADYRPDHGTVSNYHDHIAFATREIAIAAYKKLTAANIKVTEFQGFGSGVTGPHSGPGSLHHKGLAMDVPGYQHGGSGPIGPKEYAGSARVRAVLGIGGAGSGAAGAGAPRKVPGSEKRDILAEQAAENALRKEKLLGLQEEEFYYKRIAVAIANYAASIFSPEEQQLQNNLLEKRNNLIKQGASKDVIDFEMERYEMQEKFKNGIEVASEKIEENNALVKQGRMSQEKATEQNAIHNNTIEELTKNLNQVNPLLERKNKLTKDGAFLTAMASLKNRLAIVKAPTEDAARREELKQEGYRDDEIPRMMAIEEEIARLEELKQKSSDIASSISESITGAFKNIVTGSMSMQEALAGSFRSIGDFFADMVMKMIADYLKLSMLQGIKNILSMFAPGASAGGGFALGGAGGQGAAGSYGSAMSATSSLPSFTGGGGFQPVSMGDFGVAPFANGGMVTGPTLGLVGEGRYNEAVIPLPDGKSVPVQLAGGTEGATAPINTNIVVNVKNGQSDSQVTGNQGNQLGREIEGAVRQVILKEIRPGGIIYGSR